MNKRWIGLLLISVIALPPAGADSKKPGKGFWRILVKPHATWVLHETIKDEDKRTIKVETYDVRKVAGADVARLRWTLTSGKDSSDIGSTDEGRYTQVAVTQAGLYLLTQDMDDAKVADALKNKPSRSDPPKPYDGTKRNEGRYLHIRGNDLVCLGEGPRPGDGDCPDTCFGEVCISGSAGVVELSGNWAPGVSAFAQDGSR